PAARPAPPARPPSPPRPVPGVAPLSPPLNAARSSPPMSALRGLEGYQASGVVDLAKQAVISSDGPIATATLVASLLELHASHRRLLSALDLEDEAGEFLLFGKGSCLLVRPLPSRPGWHAYVACGRAPTNVARARFLLSAIAEGEGRPAP
ncbi:MAG TPA: hypothetical protein VFS00_23245, partial [Polyangiaceae bacterium]|nr:hypothetical protein [Polyangiaceae bacterium]